MMYVLAADGYGPAWIYLIEHWYKWAYLTSDGIMKKYRLILKKLEFCNGLLCSHPIQYVLTPMPLSDLVF